MGVRFEFGSGFTLRFALGAGKAWVWVRVWVRVRVWLGLGAAWPATNDCRRSAPYVLLLTTYLPLTAYDCYLPIAASVSASGTQPLELMRHNALQQLRVRGRARGRARARVRVGARARARVRVRGRVGVRVRIP